MTITDLQARKEQLTRDLTQTIANVNALQGAIQNVDWMIAELGKEEAKDSGTQTPAEK